MSGCYGCDDSMHDRTAAEEEVEEEKEEEAAAAAGCAPKIRTPHKDVGKNPTK